MPMRGPGTDETLDTMTLVVTLVTFCSAVLLGVGLWALWMYLYDLVDDNTNWDDD
jgi:hypothetical protein